MRAGYLALIAALIISLTSGLIFSLNYYHNKYQTEKQRADNAEQASTTQAQIIAVQAFNFNQFNKIAEYTRDLNTRLNVQAEKTVIQYREILRHEKTCDLPVPAAIAGGLLGYAHRLRASAVHANSPGADSTDDSSVATGEITYCQAVLWIAPLLNEIEKGNNRLAGIREIEQNRKEP